MKRISILLILFVFCDLTYAQIDTARFKIGVGAGMGIFYPEAVNNFIEQQVDNDIKLNNDVSPIYIFANYFINNTNSYTFPSNFELRNLNEIAYSETSQSSDVDRVLNYYYFWRLSSGLAVNYKIRITDIFSLRPGFGLTGHYLALNDYHAFTMGERVQLNLDFVNNEIITFEGYLGWDFAKADLNNSLIKELDYSGFIVGATVYLNIFKGNSKYF